MVWSGIIKYNNLRIPMTLHNEVTNPKSIAKYNTLEETYHKIHNHEYTYDNAVYRNSTTKITITCKVHGDFEQNPNKHMSGRKCPKCSKVTKCKLVTKTTEKFIADATAVHGTTYDYSNVNYQGCRTKVPILCSKHSIFTQTPDAHLNGKQGCPLCANEKQGFTPARFQGRHTIFYVLKLKNGLYKPGITMQKSVETRYSQDNYNDIVDDKIFEICFIDGKEAREFEMLVLRELKDYKYKGPQVFPKIRNTEILTTNPVPFIMQAHKLKAQ